MKIFKILISVFFCGLLVILYDACDPAAVVSRSYVVSFNAGKGSFATNKNSYDVKILSGGGKN